MPPWLAWPTAAARCALQQGSRKRPGSTHFSATHLFEEREAGLLRFEARLVRGAERVQRRVRPLAVLLQRLGPVHTEGAVRRLRVRLLLRAAGFR